MIVEGRGLLSILDGTAPRPSIPPSIDHDLTRWTQNNARIISWLLGSVDPSIALGLRLFTTAHEMWTDLAATYNTNTTTSRFDIQFALSRLHQGDLDVASYYNDAKLLWTEQDLLDASLDGSAATSAAALADRQQARMLHFFIQLTARI
ncbi:unnamed protein product [Linum trigynum]|uniref:Retrotransposon gag domain-containing protein n=1 Tax=Linum trigynum TaxID=586398 RepID=A0AAV2GTE3_9ROSI